ncbi:MAG TPA: type II toxin-antitoxin system VapC family toxin [Candidatus Hydrogenedentes bacterium]|nr:type II toxin-antitoxin system VapC family toxin [Candidatus Hydrogenedentota bacterium]
MIPPSRCVIDASVGIKLCVKESLSDRVESLLSKEGADENTRRYVPDLFFVECANVLWKYVVRFGYSAKDARRSMMLLRRLDLMAISTEMLLPEALNIAIGHSISVYDACYVAAAVAVEAPLITADERLVECMRDTAYRVHSLRQLR